MIKRLFLFALSLVAPALAARAGFDPYAEGGARPLAVLIQADPWAMVLGSDTPQVAIYEDGEAIFAVPADGKPAYCHARLDSGTLATLARHLQAVAALGASLRPHYDLLPAVTDQPRARFYLRAGEGAGRELTSTVRGLRAPGTALPAWTTLPGRRPPDQAPAALLELHAWLCALPPENSQPWTPRYVEVLLWDYAYAPEPSIAWPAGWPGLDSERAVRDPELSRLYLDGSMLPALREFLATRRPRGAVALDGRKWAAAYRLVFPGEPTWQAASARGNKEAKAE